MVEHAIAVTLDLVEQGAVDGRHDEPGALRPAICGRKRSHGARMPVTRAGHLLDHQGGERRAAFVRSSEAAVTP